MALGGFKITVGTAKEPIVDVPAAPTEDAVVKVEANVVDAVGTKCRAKVVNFKPYGFFVETPSGSFGLVHGKNIAGWEWKHRFDRIFPLGSEIEVTVIAVESDTNRRSFSCVAPVLPEPEAVPPPPPPPLTRQEIVLKWAEENPIKSMEAYEWLKTELADGPIYGPLTTVLGDKFGVPVPASKWILQFADFTCYAGHGDNPSDLPAVALASEADNRAYWKRIKVKAEELLENRNRVADDSIAYGEVAVRLDAQGCFPGSKWIGEFKAASIRLADTSVEFGSADISEELVIPLLAELGWDSRAAGTALVRGDGTGFAVRLTKSAADGAKSSVAVVVAKRGTDFAALRGQDNAGVISARNVVEQVLGLYNRLNNAGDCRIIWTNGSDWVVFSRELVAECIGIIAEHRGEQLMDAFASGKSDRLFRVTLPTEGSAFKWLAAFSELAALLAG